MILDQVKVEAISENIRRYIEFNSSIRQILMLDELPPDGNAFYCHDAKEWATWWGDRYKEEIVYIKKSGRNHVGEPFFALSSWNIKKENSLNKINSYEQYVKDTGEYFIDQETSKLLKILDRLKKDKKIECVTYRLRNSKNRLNSENIRKLLVNSFGKIESQPPGYLIVQNILTGKKGLKFLQKWIDEVDIYKPGKGQLWTAAIRTTKLINNLDFYFFNSPENTSAMPIRQDFTTILDRENKKLIHYQEIGIAIADYNLVNKLEIRK
jgi:hypothetical protein